MVDGPNREVEGDYRTLLGEGSERNRSPQKKFERGRFLFLLSPGGGYFAVKLDGCMWARA